MQGNTEKKGNLPEELRDILDDKARQSIGDSYREKLDPETTAELFAGITKHIYDVAHETEEAAADFDSMGKTMRFFLAIREVYVMGVLEGMDTLARATAWRIDELEKDS